MELRQDHQPAPYISFDDDVDAGYIKLTNEPVAETKEVHPSVLLDIDANGALIGIEVFGRAFVELGGVLANMLP